MEVMATRKRSDTAHHIDDSSSCNRCRLVEHRGFRGLRVLLASVHCADQGGSHHHAGIAMYGILRSPTLTDGGKPRYLATCNSVSSCLCLRKGSGKDIDNAIKST